MLCMHDQLHICCTCFPCLRSTRTYVQSNPDGLEGSQHSIMSRTSGTPGLAQRASTLHPHPSQDRPGERTFRLHCLSRR